MVSQSRLGLFCEKFIQAGWLVALIAAPLYFNIYSSRVFEPDKITLVRTLALAMGAAWLVLRAERWQALPRQANSFAISARPGAWLKSMSAANPLTLPALLLFLAYLVSTALSLSPIVSFFGSYQRLQGLYTLSAYLIIFFLAASSLKTRADVERAITLALLASFPVALYGLIQHYFLDPLPWVGDVTTRVASTLGNSIFIGAFLILTIPLALARLIRTSRRAAAPLSAHGRRALAAATVASFAAIAAAWGLSFDLGAKNFIEANYTGTLTPEQLSAASGAFTLALVISLLVLALWGGGAYLLKLRAANLLLIPAYAALLAVETLAIVFSQSRGPLLGLFGGLFAFGVLYALVRGARRWAIGAFGLVVFLLIALALVNIPASPLSSLRDLPYVGRLGRVFELEGGTGKVRVLIWQGALQLVLPHSPLQSPTTGADPFNPIRPLIGYGPETMYVAYNRFYPPELGQLESRNATPDRSHNETFDALVTTGLFGLAAENILFLLAFYLGLKWLGLVPDVRARNILFGAWFGGGIVAALVFGFILGWQFIGVALPGGMMLGLFGYLLGFAVRNPARSTPSPAEALWLVALLAVFVAHFIEIHFGIAIVSTRLYFWFFAAALVVLGTRRVTLEPTVPVPDMPQPVPVAPQGESSSERARRKRERTPAPTAALKRARRIERCLSVSKAYTPAPAAALKQSSPRPKRVSAAPLITLAFLVGFILAVMAFDYINTNNVAALGSGPVSGLAIVTSALTVKNTTAGGMPSYAMLWLFVTTLLLGAVISIAEWGYTFTLSIRDWAVASFLFLVLCLAIFSGFVFYHVLLIATPGAGILDALLSSVVFFTVFTFIVVAMTAVTLLFDEPLPAAWVRRTTNWVVMPVLLIVAAALILATNIDPVRADMLYKQAASLTGDNNAASIALFQRALGLQPQQDYYLLFLGRAYLDAAKNATDANERAQDLQRAEDALLRARAINPYNTDHSANLARLAQARGSLASGGAAQIAAYKQADDYFAQATRLSPNTAHLYDQHAQALMEYASVLERQGDSRGAAEVRGQAQQQIAQALNVDATFCLTYAVRAQTQTDWRARVDDALKAIQTAPQCGDVFVSEGLSIAVNALSQAGDEAAAAQQGGAFEAKLKSAAQANPSLETYTTLANYYSKAGRIPEALSAIDSALGTIPLSDAATLKRYQDFRYTLVQLQQALQAANAAPNDAAAQRTVAQQWLARGQFDFALPAFQKAIRLDPSDYTSQRAVTLLLITLDRLPEAASQIVRSQAIAPTGDQPFWQALGTVVNGIQSSDSTQAVGQLQTLVKNANSQDYALVSALRALAAKLKGAG